MPQVWTLSSMLRIHPLPNSILKTPFRAPQANAFCERFVGSVQRECLDYLIPLNERHLWRILQEWVSQHNKGRPYSSLGSGIPDPPLDLRLKISSRHCIALGYGVVVKPIRDGLHHDYGIERFAA